MDSYPDTWRSLEDLEGTMPEGVGDDDPATFPRRRFLALLAASAAFTGLAGCRWPEQKIAPYAHRPQGTEPGVPRHFATSMDFAGAARPLLVTCLDGRPIKIEGNPGHPAARGASDIFAQASLLELYEPDRSREPRHRGAPAAWEDFDAFVAEALAARSRDVGRGLVVLAEPNTSPTTARLRALFARRFPRATWIDWDPASREAERAGARMVFGPKAPRALYDLARVRVLVSIESDLFSGHPDALRHTRDWADAREPGPNAPPRLYALESAYSLTGTMADERLPLRPAEVEAAMLALLARIAAARGISLATEAGTATPSHEIERIARDLLDAGPQGLVVAGPTMPPAVHAAIAAINHALGSDATCCRWIADPQAAETANAWERLDAARAAGPVECVLVLGGNPAYDGPADRDLAGMIRSARASIRLGLHHDETSELCQWHAPRAHFLESWGDATGWDGSRCAVQPMIAPLYEGRTVDEFLARVLGLEKTSGHELVQETWGRPEEWTEWLRTGFVAAPDAPRSVPAPDPAGMAEAVGLLARASAGASALELLFRPDGKVHDGRFGNNPWLQELPDPLTKLTWGNAAFVDPTTAAREKLRTGDMIELAAGRGRVTLPVYIAPGQAEGTVIVPLGYGRTMPGAAVKDIGWNAYPLRTSAAPWRANSATMRRVGGRYRFACTADHFLIDELGRKEAQRRGKTLVREATYARFAAEPASVAAPKHAPKQVALWKPFEHDGHRWAMTIDLNRCNGCAACVLACQAENNVPIVGPDQVRRGREMHWLRIDRLYRGDVANPKVRHQPMTCLHCENAPCEQVCPVAATVHSREGVNEMVYNRCIGTRYCSNNCPVKVRRFNYYDYYGRLDEIEKMRMNPEVSVRARGVMEKCSLCIQRIQQARIAARREGRTLAGADILPACAQACPARAIQFGDLSIEGDDFVRRFTGPRAYEILEELNLKARVRYLARLENPHPDTTREADTR
ncbi:MAG: 4Fe-4S dicluster domain-containing protein [Candidatus Sumerlaeia bacterium]|nr:4Fe-4S dicluster domain-containing protein [Candidatus Sumerlaeia bacterium]